MINNTHNSETTVGRVPAHEANSNNGTSRSNTGAKLIAEVESSVPGEADRPLIHKGTEDDELTTEEWARLILIYWRDSNGVYVVKSPLGVGYFPETDLEDLVCEIEHAPVATITMEPLPEPTTLNIGPKSVPTLEDSAEPNVALVPARGLNDEVHAFAVQPLKGIVVQVKPGEAGILFLITGERLTDEAFKAAHYVFSFDAGGFATVYKNLHGRTGRTRASVASIDAAKALRLADRDAVRKLAEETKAIFLPRKNGPSASLSDYARTFAAVTLWPKILDEANLSSEDLDGLISRVNDCIFHHGLKYANGSIGIQVPTSQVEVTLCGTANAPWAWPGDRTAEEIAGLGLLRALKAHRQARGERK